MVPPDSHRISRARCYLGYNSEDSTFSCTGLSPSTATPSRGLPLTTAFSHSPPDRQIRPDGPTTPTTQRLPAITCNRFSLFRFRSPLLTESRLFSLPAGTEMFHFPAFPPHTLCVQVWVTPHDWGRVSPFGHPWISARLTAPQGFSQSPTSFIGSWCQGIHRMPLITCHKDARIHCAVLKEQPDTPSLLSRLPAHTGGSKTDKALCLLAERDTRVFSQDPTAYRTRLRSPSATLPRLQRSSTNSRNNNRTCISQHPHS